MAGLDKAESWAQEPVERDVNAVLGAGQGAAEPEPEGGAGQGAQHEADQGHYPVQAVPSRPPARGRRPVPGDAAAPWAVVGADAGSTKTTTMRLPLELYEKLKFLGETTYGESMNAIVIGAIQREVARRMKERGHGQQ